MASLSSYSILRYMTLTQDGNHFNFWDGAFKDMHLYVRQSTTIVVDGQWEANLPGVAYAYLGTPALAWAVLMFNPDIQDPITDVKPGVMLRIPDASSLKDFLALKVTLQNSGNFQPSLAITTL